MEIGAGTNLGRYQLLAEIGRGAMGTVYQALDPEIERLVAIKTFALLDADSTQALAFRERFAQEARAAGRLAHPGIVTIYDRGEEPTTNTPYIVMEYVAGQPLSALLSGGSARLEERFALQVARDVAEALAYAHERGVIHRDIKPANILITEEGNAKVADFGVARLDTSNLTLNGEVFGTPAYMAPEQITGGQVDGRSDIFSLGVILYTMLIGFRPFQGNSPHTIGFKVVNQEPVPITSFHLDLSKHTEYVVARAMAKNPANRYQTGTEFAQDLSDIIEGREPRSRQDVTVRVSAEVFRVAEGYRRLPLTRGGLKPKHISVFKEHPSTGNTPAPGPVLVPEPGPVAVATPVSAERMAAETEAEPAPSATPKFKLPQFKLPEFKFPQMKLPQFKLPQVKLPEFRLPQFKALQFKLPDLKFPALKLPEFNFPELKLPQISIPNWEVASLLLLGVACVGAITGFLIVHTQRVALHRADVQIGMPSFLAEALPAPPAMKRRVVVERVEPQAKPSKTKTAVAHAPQPKAKAPVSDDLDYTVIRTARKTLPIAPVMVASTSAPVPASKPSLPVAPTATLELALEHHFSDADFSVWVDDKLAYSNSVHGEEKKRLLVLHGVEGKETHDIHFSSGAHVIKVQVVSTSAQFDHTETVRGTFKEAGKAVLNIHCNKHGLEVKLAGGV